MLPHEKKAQWKGYGLLLTAAVVYSFSGLAIFYLKQTFNPFAQVAVRASFTLIPLVLFVLWKRMSLRLPNDQWTWMILLMAGQVIGNLFFIESLMRIKVASALFYLYLGQMITGTVMDVVWFRKKVRPQMIVSVGVTMVALFLYAWPVNQVLIGIGAACGIGCGVAEAEKTAVMKKMNTDGYKVVITFYQFWGAVVIAGLVSLIAHEQAVRGAITNQTLTMLLVMVFVTVGVNASLLHGIKKYELGLAGVITATEIFFGMILYALFLHQYPNLHEVIGGVVLFLAMLIASPKYAHMGMKKTEPELA